MEPGSELFKLLWAIAFVAGVVLMALALVGGITLCTWALAPLNKQGQAMLPVQFRIVDLAGLLFELSVISAILGNVSEATRIPSPCPLAFAGVLVCGCWWAGVRLLSRARVDDAKRRLTMHLVVVPLTILCSAYLVLGGVAGFLALMSIRDSNDDPAPILIVGTGIAIAALLMTICRMLSAWIARAAGNNTPAAISPQPAEPPRP